MQRFVVVGDSVAFGQFVGPMQAWPGLLAQDVPLEVYAWCGDTTRLALERTLPLIQRDGLSGAYVQFGINDCNVWESDKGHPRVSRLAFAANLIEIVERLRLFGAETVYLGTNHLVGKCDVEPYNAAIRAVAKKIACPLVEHEYAGNDLMPDGVHPSVRGHELYAARVRAALKGAT